MRPCADQTSAMTSQYKLTYFDARGKAELLRILFHAGGQSFEDERIKFEDMPGLKPSLPFGQLPSLQIYGQYFAQTVAIANYLAREFGFYGESNLDCLKIDQVIQHVDDMWPQLGKALYMEKDPAVKEQLIQKLKEETVPNFFKSLEKLLEKENTGYFAGSQLSLADMAVFSMGEMLQNQGLGDIAAFQLLKANGENVTSHPKIAQYLKERKPA